MVCQTCGFALGPFDTACIRCKQFGENRPEQPEDVITFANAVFTSDGFDCPKCAGKLQEGNQFCPACGLRFQNRVPPMPRVAAETTTIESSTGVRQTDALEELYGGEGRQRAASGIGIFLMWAFSAAAWAGYLTVGFGLGLILDVVSCAIAIALVTHSNSIDKANGWVKLGLEIAGFVISFINSAAGGGVR